MAGVYSFGRGLFRRDELQGSRTSYAYLHRLEHSQMVMSKLKAWEGAFAVVDEVFAGSHLSPEFPTYDIDPAFALPEYVREIVSHPSFRDLAAAQSRGMGGRKERVNPDAILDVVVDLPPLLEQRRVVDILRHADEAAAAPDLTSQLARQARLALVDEFVDAQLAAGIPVRRLDEVASLRLGFTKGVRTRALVSAPYLRAANLTFGELRLSDVASIDLEPREVAKHTLQVGDVLMTEGGNPWDLGRGWIWEGQIADCVHQNSVIRATAFRDGVEPRYVAHLLESRLLRRYFEGQATRTSGVAHLGVQGAAGAPVPVASADDQRRLVAILDAMRELDLGARAVRDLGRASRANMATEFLAGTHEIPASYDRFLEAIA